MAHRRARLTLATVVALTSAFACTKAPTPTPAEPVVQPRDDAPVRHVHPDGSPTIAEAIAAAQPGTTIVIHGEHVLRERVWIERSGRPDAPITITGAPGERTVIDARNIEVRPPSAGRRHDHDDGAITLRDAHHVVVRDLEIHESRGAGIAVHDSTDIEITGNLVVGTFGSGIAAWDHEPALGPCARIRIVGNTVREANDVERAPPWFPRGIEPPHESISLGGVVDFEVAYNEVAAARKEGIDVKETSARGRVHHNWVHDAARQCLYLDAWFGVLSSIELDHNLAERCAGAGIAIAVEGKGAHALALDIHDNVVRDNAGSGVLLAVFGVDGPRRDVRIHHNTITGNGGGTPGLRRGLFWIPGGIFLWSANVEGLAITHNRIADNDAFQIGLSRPWFDDGRPTSRRITVEDNAVAGPRATVPVVAGGGKPVEIREWEASDPSRDRDPDAASTSGANLDPAQVGPASAPRGTAGVAAPAPGAGSQP
jgi:nitrous oxidase accessory protein NosD